MSLDETRQLGIEFERRVQTMIPETEMISKLDTETIYSFLNQYQDKFIHDIYKVLDNIPSPSKPSAYVERIIQGLLTSYRQNNVTTENNSYSITLPRNFGLYVDSYTHVSDTYSYKSEGPNSGVIPNTLVSKSKAQELITRPQDAFRIMRQPIAYLDDNNALKVFYDRYTQPTDFVMSYYKTPQYMDLFTEKKCELPPEAFDDLVTGAVDLYVQYVAGAEARKRQMQEQQQKQNKKEEQ